MSQKATKVVHYPPQGALTDNSVELFSLTANGVTETYLRRGFSIELVEGEPDLNFRPEPAETMDLRKAASSSWSQSGGFKTREIPKIR